MNRIIHIETHTYASTMMKVMDSLLTKGHTDERRATALVFTTRIDFEDHKSQEEPAPIGGYLHVACYAPSNYVHVLAAFTNRPKPARDFRELHWQPITCHDSCWREDGVVSVIAEAVHILNKAALDEFKLSEDEVSFHIGLQDLVIGVEDAEVVLKSGLTQAKRHGKLAIPVHDTRR